MVNGTYTFTYVQVKNVKISAKLAQLGYLKFTVDSTV